MDGQVGALAQPHRELKHSPFGIASFVLAILFGAAHFLNIAVATVIEASTSGGMSSKSPIAIIVGFAMCGFLLVNLLGARLGLAGMFERDRKKVFPILGTLLNLGLMVGVVALVAIGLIIGE